MNKAKARFKLILLIAIIIVLPVILYLTCKDTLFNVDWLKNLPSLLEKNKNISLLLVILFQILQVIVCILPGQPIQLASGFMYGPLFGYLISIVGAIIGATITYFIAKVLGSEAIEVLFGKDEVNKYKKKINSGKGLLILFIIYLIPGLPKDLLGYVSGISDIKYFPYIILSSIGRSPGMLGSLFIGSFIEQKNYTLIIIIAIFSIIIFAICFIKRKVIIDYLDKIENSSEVE